MAWTHPESSLSSKGAIPGILKELTTQTVFIALDENLIYFWVLRKGAEVHSRQKQIEQMRKCHSVDANHVERDWRRFWCQMRGLFIRGCNDGQPTKREAIKAINCTVLSYFC